MREILQPQSESTMHSLQPSSESVSSCLLGLLNKEPNVYSTTDYESPFGE